MFGVRDVPEKGTFPVCAGHTSISTAKPLFRSGIRYTAPMSILSEQFEQVGIAPNAGAVTKFAFLGIWFQQTWIFWINTNNPLLPGIVPWQTLYLVLALCMCGIGFAAHRLNRKTLPFENAMAAAAVALGFAASVCVMLAPYVAFGAALAVTGLVLGAVCLAWIYVQWGAVYSLFTLRQAVAFLFTGGIIAALAKAVLFLLPPVIAGIVASMLPAFAVLTCRRAKKFFAGLEGRDETTATSAPHSPNVASHEVFFTMSTITALWKVMLVFVVFSLANSLILALDVPAVTAGTAKVFLLERALEALLCGCVLLYVFQFHRVFDFVRLWRVVLLVLATDFVINILWPGSEFQTFFAGVALNLIVLFVWLVLADISRHSDMHPFSVFGFGWAAYAVPFFAGSVLAAVMNLSADTVSGFGALLYLVCIAATFLLDSRDQNTKRIFSDFDESKPDAVADFADIDSRCAQIAVQRHLTARELEIMQMICKGRSKAYIAETLYVTENTVKGHAKRLYMKLGVHSKQELQKLIEIE